MVRAKFKVGRKAETEAGYEVLLYPVTGGSPENEQFYKYTPSGNITLGTINKEAAEQFQVGKQFYIDFTPAE